VLVQSSRVAAIGVEVGYLLDIRKDLRRYLPRQNDLEGEIWPGNREFCDPYEMFDRY
jgi:hypothetical protein